MHQHLRGCPARGTADGVMKAITDRYGSSVVVHRVFTASSNRRPLARQRLAVSCPAVEQDTEAPSSSGRPCTDSDLIQALFQTEPPTIAAFAEDSEAVLKAQFYAKLRNASTLPQLCSVIQLEASFFNHKSVTHALYKLSNMCRAYFTQLQSANLTTRAAQQAAWVEYVEPALQTLGQLLIRHMAQCDAWGVSISFWAYGNLQCSDEAVFAALCERGLQIMHTFTPHDCAAALVGISKLRVRPRCQREFVDYLLSHASGLLSRVDQWRTQEVANVLWGLSKIGAAGPSRRALLEGLLEMTLWRQSEFKIKELCLIVYSCGRLQLRMPLQLARITAHIAGRMDEMNPTDAAHVVWGCAKLGMRPRGHLLEQLPELMCKQLQNFKSQEICNLLYGYGCLHCQHPYLLESVARSCIHRLHEFSTQDLCLTLWSFGMLRYCPEREDFFDLACRILLQRSNRLIPLQITMAAKAFARMMYQPTPEFMQRLSQLAIQKMHQFSPLELSQLLWAYSKLGYRDVQLFEAAVATFLQDMKQGTRRLPKTTVDTVVLACGYIGFWPQPLIDTAESQGIYVNTTKQRELGDVEQLLPFLPDSPGSHSSSSGTVFAAEQSSASSSNSSVIADASNSQVMSAVHTAMLDTEAWEFVQVDSSQVPPEQQQDHHQWQEQQQPRPLPPVLDVDALGQQRRQRSSSSHLTDHQQLQQQQQESQWMMQQGISSEQQLKGASTLGIQQQQQQQPQLFPRSDGQLHSVQQQQRSGRSPRHTHAGTELARSELSAVSQPVHPLAAAAATAAGTGVD